MQISRKHATRIAMGGTINCKCEVLGQHGGAHEEECAYKAPGRTTLV
jgi:hypothetical protein